MMQLIITGRTARKANRRYFIYSDVAFRFLVLQGRHVRCTDEDEIRRVRVDHTSTLPRNGHLPFDYVICATNFPF